MRQIAVALCLASVLACSSSGSLGKTANYLNSYDAVWFAVLEVVRVMDGRVTSSNKDQGMVIARLEMDALGSIVLLDIAVRRWMDGAEVRVSATYPTSTGGDPNREAPLRLIEEDFMGFLAQALPTAGARRQ